MKTPVRNKNAAGWTLQPDRCLKAVVTVAAITAALHAQQPPPVPPTENEPSIAMSVFEVSAASDRGYQATTTLSGTRTGEMLKNLPLAVSVVTSELIADIGATDLSQAVQFAAGVQSEEGAYAVNGSSNRGIATDLVTRNFFVWLSPQDLFSVERVEIIRGPNAVLYGEAEPGGLVNSITKQARGANRQRLTFRTGSNGGYRVTIDADRRVNEWLDLRINALYEDSDGWRTWEKTKKEGLQLAARVRPTKTTTLRLEAERGEWEINRPVAILLDRFSRWNGTSIPAGTPLNATGALSPASTGTVAIAPGAAPRWIWLNGQFYNFSTPALRTYRQSDGTNRPVYDAEFGPGYEAAGGAPYLGAAYLGSYAGRPLLPADRNYGGPHLFENTEYNALVGTIEQQVGATNLELAAHYQRSTRHRNRPSGASTVIRVDPNQVFPGNNQSYLGEPYVDLENFGQLFQNETIDVRLTAVHDFELPFTTQRLIATGSYREDKFRSGNYRETIIPGTPLAIGQRLQDNQVVRRHYFRDGAGNASTFGGYTEPGVTDFIRFVDSNWTDTDLTSFSVALSGQYLKGRGRTLLGWRQDRFHAYRAPAFGGNQGDPVTGYRGINFAAATDQYATQESPSLGAVFFITPNVSVYGNYSGSFRINPTATLIDDTQAPPRTGRGYDAGLRFALLQERVTATVGVYDINYSNATVAISAVSAVALRTMIGDANVTPPISQVGGANDTFDLKTRGYELELVANVTDNWRILANFSHNDPLQTNGGGRFISYYEQALALYNRGEIGAGQFETQRVVVEQEVARLREGRVPAGNRSNLLNVFTRYQFSDGLFKGAYVGGGANWRDKAVFLDNPGFDSLPAYTTFSGLIGYEATARFSKKSRWSAALNINNITDETAVLGRSAGTLTYLSPREFVLTINLAF